MSTSTAQISTLHTFHQLCQDVTHGELVALNLMEILADRAGQLGMASS